MQGVSFAFDTPQAGWFADHGATWAKLDLDRIGELDGLPDGAALAFWSPIGTYVDPCEHARAQPVGPTATDLAVAMSSIPGIEPRAAATPTALGGLPATALDLDVADELPCAADLYYLWYDRAGSWRWVTSPGDRIRVWIVEVAGARLVIEAETRKAASQETVAELQRLIDSIRFTGATDSP